jgi:hypothetical protein
MVPPGPYLVINECWADKFLDPEFDAAGAVAGDGGRRLRRHQRIDLALD